MQTSANTLIVKHTKDRHGAPLACVHNLPGDGAELSPAQLRRLARGLQAIAEECDRGAGLLLNMAVTYDLERIGADKVA